MIIDNTERVNFLKRLHLFRGLDEAQLIGMAEELSELSYGAHEVVVSEGDEADSFFLIFSGTVEVTRWHGEEQQRLALLVPGDYFGEEALLAHRHRSATVSTKEDTLLLVLSRDDFETLLKHTPKLKPNLEVAVSSRRLARRLQFKWLRPGEVIYFLARKHWVMLARALLGPLVALLVPLTLYVVGQSFALQVMNLLASISLGVLLLLLIWRWLDWGNDYYIVTNQRVVWLERVIGLYDSRQEAPLTTILSVTVETEMTGRILDYGDVVVRTFIGKIRFAHVSFPYQAAAMVEEYWGRTKEVARKVEMDAMKQALRKRLGLEVVKPEEPEPAPETPLPPAYKPSFVQLVFANIFRVRIESGGTITYRKHWFILFKQTWKPGFLFLILAGFLLYRLGGFLPASQEVSAGGLNLDAIGILLLIGLVVSLGWWVYEYIDWSNDIFQVTPDQILDVDRTPFGREERKAAPLESILGTEYRRIGPIALLLNFGTVYISVPGIQMAFEDVYDPPSVQQDIDRRRMMRTSSKKEAETKADRERVADWFAAYHRSSDELRREEGLLGSQEDEEET